VNNAVEKGSGGENNRFAMYFQSASFTYSLTRAVVHDQTGYHLLAQSKVRFRLHGRFHAKGVFKAVTLHSRALNSRPFTRAETFILDARCVGSLPHLPAKRIYLTHEMPLPQTADGRIARHQPYGIGVQSIELNGQAHASATQRGFTPGMAGSHNHNVQSSALHVKYVWKVS
jgi:hypothetical protein